MLQWNSLVPLLHISVFYWAYLFNSETKCVPYKPLPLFVRAGLIMSTKRTCLLIVSHVLKFHKQPRYEVTGRLALIFSETLPHQSPTLSKADHVGVFFWLFQSRICDPKSILLGSIKGKIPSPQGLHSLMYHDLKWSWTINPDPDQPRGMHLTC